MKKILILSILIIALSIGCSLLFKEKSVEKYITNIVDDSINEELSVEPINVDELLCQKNTYYNVLKNYPDKYDEIFNRYCTDYILLGDSAAWMQIECNYEQYEQNYMKEINLEKYMDIINIKLAKVHEYTCNLPKYNENITLEEVVKLQSEEVTDYTGELIGKNGYFEITGILIMNGNNTSEEAWKNNSRAKKISVIINGEEEYGFDLEDTMEVQLIDFNYCQDGIDTPIDIEIKVLDIYEGDFSEDVYISDIRFGFDSSISGAR